MKKRKRMRALIALVSLISTAAVLKGQELTTEGSWEIAWEQGFPLEIESEFRMISSGRRRQQALSLRRLLR